MHSKRRLMVASAIAVVATAAFLPGAGLGSAALVPGPHWIPAGLADAIHARFGAGAIRSSRAAAAKDGPGLGFQVSLSTDGTTALVGAPGVDNDKGAAYIFHVSDAGSWASTDTPTATLMNKPGVAKNQVFGLGVALSGDGTTAFVGAPFAAQVGAIYVFHVSAEDAWVSTSTPTATLKVTQGIFVGLSLALSSDGTTLVAGAPFYNSLAGGAYVFHTASEAAWASTSTPTATLDNALESGDDAGVGFSVAMSGDGTTALLSDDENTSGGDAYLYHVAAADAWVNSSTPTAILSDANSGANDGLGYSVALSGDGTVALLGAPGANSGAGSVAVFHAAAEAAWITTPTPTAILSNANGTTNDAFGVRVAASADGATALLDAPGVGAARGATYVFHVADAGSWASSSTPTVTLTNSGSKPSDILGDGATLSADGATAFAGAPGVRYQTGAVDVFHVADAGSWASTSAPTAVLTDSALDACVVPKLKGLSLHAAKASLKARSCRLGKVSRIKARGKKGHIVSQSQKPGARIAVGSKIRVKIAK